MIRNRHSILWTILWINLWGFAIIGPIFCVIGIASFWIDIGDSMWMFGQAVETQIDKVIWTIATFTFGCLGLFFVLRRLRNAASHVRYSSTSTFPISEGCFQTP